MTRWFAVLFLLAFMAAVRCAGTAAVFPLNDGTKLEGEPISFNAQGLVVKTADGNFAPRVGWTNFTQEALKELAKQPRIKPLIEPYLDVDESETETKPSLDIKPKPHERLERPDPKAGLGAMFSSSLT